MRHFINLTNGIEWLPLLPPGSEGWSVTRIRSTAIEKNDWEGLLADLDHHLLFCLSQGFDCHLYDMGTRRQKSKTITKGIPTILATLNHFWLGGPPTDLTNKILRAISRTRVRIKEKLNYYRKILNTDTLHLTGHSISTQMDGNLPFYKGILQDAFLPDMPDRQGPGRKGPPG